MKIVAFGGCVHKQQNLPLKKHYHFLLRDMLYQKQNHYPEVKLETYNQYFRLADRIIQNTDAKTDVLILFVRPFPLHPLIKPFIRYRSKQQREETMLHPVFNKANIGRQASASIEQNMSSDKKGNSLMHLTFARANMLTGKIFGLDKWAVNYITAEILKINKECLNNNTHLILAGPPLYPASAALNRFCINLNAHIKNLAPTYGFSHADIARACDENGNETIQADGRHLTESGHKLLAQSIFKHIPAC